MLIINNLASGYGNGAIYDFIRSFSEDKDEIIIRNTTQISDIAPLLHDATSFDIVVAAGGDATIGTISYHLTDSQIPILPFPAGTNNVITENLFMPNEPHALAKLARNGKTMNFDLGEINGEHGFGLNAGAGFSASITRDARQGKRMWGVFAYAGAALSNMKPQLSKIKLTLDGKTIESQGVGIMILNFAKIGLDLSMTHMNRPRDGKFDVVIFKAKTALDYIPAITAAALDNAINFPDRSKALEVFSAKEVHIETEFPMEIETDNHLTNMTTPFSAKILKQAAKYIVPEECMENYNNNE